MLLSSLSVTIARHDMDYMTATLTVEAAKKFDTFLAVNFKNYDRRYWQAFLEELACREGYFEVRRFDSNTGAPVIINLQDSGYWIGG
jgi:hypothetical protein